MKQNISLELPAELCAQVEALARQRQLSQAELFAAALKQFLQAGAAEPCGTPREILQGEIYWLQLDHPGATAVGAAHPHVVIQDNLLNRSRIETVVVCAVTSNRKRANEPGNILLEAGEANLTRPSVLVVSQLASVEKARLGAYIGTLSPQRIEQIWDGLRFQQAAFGNR